MARDREGELGLMFMGIGAMFFYQSLKKIKLQRRIKDIGTSRIASAALGESVEINATVLADPQHIIVSPLSGKRCLAFTWDLCKEVGSGKNRRWQLQYRFYSTPYVYVTDESKGIAALDLSSCEFQDDLKEKEVIFNDSSYSIPAEVMGLLKSHKMLDGKESSFLFSNRYRLQETVIEPREKFYILGTAALTPKTEMPLTRNLLLKFGKRNSSLITRVKEAFRIKRVDPETLKAYDKNNNSRLDEEESVALYRDIEEGILRKYNQPAMPADYLKSCKFIFTRSKDGSLFSSDNVLVSRKTQAELVSSLQFSALLSFFGGPALFILGIWILWNKYSSRNSYPY